MFNVWSLSVNIGAKKRSKDMEKILLRISLFIYNKISKNIGLKIREYILKHHDKHSHYFDDISISYKE